MVSVFMRVLIREVQVSECDAALPVAQVFGREMTKWLKGSTDGVAA